MAKQTVKKCRTLIKIAVQKTIYDENEGACTSYEIVQVPIGLDENNKPILTDIFYCEWLGTYGATAIQQQSDGAILTARVRMPFVKAAYDALQTENCLIYKHGKSDKQNTFCLNSSADNYLNENKMLEFQVKQYEVK